jgi:hypothetical protein
MKTFNAVKDQISTLEKVLNAFEVEIGDVYSHDAINKEFDLRLRTREAQLDGKEKGIKIMEEHQKEEKEFLDRTRAEQNIREEHIKEETKKLEGKRLELATQSSNLDIQKKQVEELIGKYAGLKDKENELVGREAILTKEKTIDNERKQILDIREKKNKDEQERLQRISDSLT